MDNNSRTIWQYFTVMILSISVFSSLPARTEKNEYQKFLKTIPDIPTGVVYGRPIIKPTQSWKREYNRWELPEFFAAWPYRSHSVCRLGSSQILRNTWDLLTDYRKKYVTRDYSWMPVVVNMASLGNMSEAARCVFAKLGNWDAQARFPAFFGPGHDWLTDHNWGESGMAVSRKADIVINPEF